MKNLFVPFELAKLMKEKVFDEECFGWYAPHLKKPVDDPKDNLIIEKTKNQSFWMAQICSAPTYQQCTDWLREKHGMIIAIAVFKHKESNQELNYWPKIHFLISDVVSTDTADWEGEDSVDYYQALTAGIEQVLTLI